MSLYYQMKELKEEIDKLESKNEIMDVSNKHWGLLIKTKQKYHHQKEAIDNFFFILFNEKYDELKAKEV